MIDYGVLAVTCIGAIVWLVRLEGRINGHDTLFTERARLFEDRHDAIIERLKRIEGKLDRSNGHAEK